MNDTASPSVSIIVFFARYKYKIVVFTAMFGLVGTIFQSLDRVYFRRTIAVGEYVSSNGDSNFKIIESFLEKPRFVQMFSEKIISTLTKNDGKDILQELKLHLPHSESKMAISERLSIHLFPNIAKNKDVSAARLLWEFLLQYRSEMGRIYLDTQFSRDIDLRPLVFASAESIKYTMDRYKKYVAANKKKESEIKLNRVEAKLSQIAPTLRERYKNLLQSYHRSRESLDGDRFPYDIDIDDKRSEASSGTFSKSLQLGLFRDYLASIKSLNSKSRKKFKGSKLTEKFNSIGIFDNMSETLSQAEKASIMSEFLSKMAWESLENDYLSEITFGKMDDIFVNSSINSVGNIIRRYVVPFGFLFALFGLFFSLGVAIVYEVFVKQNL